MSVYRAERDAMEAHFLTEARASRNQPAADRAEFAARCFAEADQATSRWDALVEATPTTQKMPRSYQKIWGKLIEEAGHNFGFRSDFASTPGG